MKPIRPRDEYQVHRDYPSAVEDLLSRRRFLGATVAGSAAAVGGLVLANDATSAPRRAHRRAPKKLLRAPVPFPPSYTFRGSNYRLTQLVAQTHDKRLVAFLKDRKEQTSIRKIVGRILWAHSCADLMRGKRLVRLERSISRGLAAHYRKRTRRRARPPTVIIFVSAMRQYVCGGSCPTPRPYCNPPAPRKRRSRKRPRPLKRP